MSIYHNLYSVNNDFTLFDDSCNIMNLNKFSEMESTIHKANSVSLSGIHKPFTYIGRWLTFFALHLEDVNLNSINFLHRGKEKFWYLIPASETSKLEN